MNSTHTKTINYYLSIHFNAETPCLCLKEENGKFILSAKALDETKKVKELIAQARLFELVAQKLSYENSKMTTPITHDKENELEIQAEIIFKLFQENLGEFLIHDSFSDHSLKLSHALLSRAEIFRQLCAQLEKVVHNDHLIPSKEFLNTLTSPDSIITTDSTQRKETYTSKLRRRTSNKNFQINETLSAKKSVIENLSLEKTTKSPLYEEIVFLRKWWDVNYSLQKSSKNKEALEGGISFKTFKKHPYLLLQQRSLGPITNAQTCCLVTPSAENNIDILAHDINRQMRITILTEPYIVIDEKKDTLVAHHHFRNLVDQFCKRYFISHSSFSKKVMSNFDASFKDFTQLILNKNEIDSDIDESDEFTSAAKNFLNKVFSYEIDPNNSLLTKQLIFFLKSMTQEIYSLTFLSVKIGLLSTLNDKKSYFSSDKKEKDLFKYDLVEKSNCRELKYTFEEKYFTVATTIEAKLIHDPSQKITNSTPSLIQTFPEKKILGEISITTHLTCIYFNQSPWEASISIDIPSGQGSEIKTLITQPLENCGFNVQSESKKEEKNDD